VSPRSGSAPQALALHENLVLVEAGDAALLAELRADRRIGPLLPATISDRVAATGPRSAAALLASLARAGHTPKVEGMRGKEGL
jgi:hypothetical protein